MIQDDNDFYLCQSVYACVYGPVCVFLSGLKLKGGCGYIFLHMPNMVKWRHLVENGKNDNFQGKIPD